MENLSQLWSEGSHDHGRMVKRCKVAGFDDGGRDSLTKDEGGIYKLEKAREQILL